MKSMTKNITSPKVKSDDQPGFKGNGVHPSSTDERKRTNVKDGDQMGFKGTVHPSSTRGNRG